MVAIKLENFGGMIPMQDARVLPTNFASSCEDVYLPPGALQGFRQPQAVYSTLNSATKKVFRIQNNSGTLDFVDSTYIEFADVNTDLVKAPITQDSYDRYYWASPSIVPQYSTFANIQAGNPPLTLGIPTPETAPLLSSTGGTSTTTEERSYVYTWVSAYGEEGPPSPPANHLGKIDDAWTVILSAPLSGDTTNRNLTHTNIYRTVTGSDGSTNYYFVQQISIATLSMVDSFDDATVTGQGELLSNGVNNSGPWTGPPTTLQGIVAMPNGMLVGWSGKDIWFCEPYRPHAWPVGYVVSVEFPVVGLGVFGTTLFIATTGKPAVCSGIAPSAMVLQAIDTPAPCLSRGSIVSTLDGVYYASEKGLMVANPGVVEVVTNKLFNRQFWHTCDPYNLQAARYGGSAYVAFPVYPSTATTGVYIDPTDQRTAFTLLSTEAQPSSVATDLASGEILILEGRTLKWFDSNDETTTLTPYTWASKEFQFLVPLNFEAMKIFFAVPSGLAPLQPEVSNPSTLTSTMYGIVTIYADGAPVVNREIRTSGAMMRLPSGFMANVWQIKLNARVIVKNVQIATSAKELASV